jgi:hypothetical protein
MYPLGVHFEQALKETGYKIILRKEPDNKEDKMAVAVHIEHKDTQQKVGYIPNPYNFPIFKIMDEAPNLLYEAHLVRQLDFDENRPVFYISFSLERQAKLLRELKKSPYVVT